MSEPGNGAATAGGIVERGGTGERAELLRGGTELVMKAVERAAEDWGAGWEAGIAGGRLELPVSAGLRHGRVSARLDLESGSAAGATGEEGPRTRVVLRPERAEYHLWTPAVVILLVAVAGALVTVLWPFFPELLPIAPFGAILGLSAWFLIVTRLQNRGPEEFLALVASQAGELLEGGPGDGDLPESME